MNMETKQLLVARAKTVIIATGGAGRMHYQGFPTSNHYGATADGLVLGYRVGAKLLYADTLQYHPTGAAYPEQIFGALVTEKVRGVGAKLVNAKGEVFMHPLETRDVSAASIIRECTTRANGVDTGSGQAVWLDTPMIEIIGGEMDYDYMMAVKDVMIDQDTILRQKDLNIVYTPMHGAGRQIVPLCLRSWGFQNIHVVPEQMVIDGNFPTVVSPNPENAEAMTLGMQLGTKLGADLVIASDPDADRIAIVCRNDKGEWVIINGNQTNIMFHYYIINNMKRLGKFRDDMYIVKTIVTSELIRKIADAQGVTLTDEYTGFKWIANRIRMWEGKRKYIGGGEESFGFLPYDAVRDKCSPSAICLICEIAAYAKDNGMTLYDYLLKIYEDYGFQRETTINVVRPGKTGAEEIQAMMKNYRENPPLEIAGEKVCLIKDYKILEQKKLVNGKWESEKFEMPLNATSNVLQYFTEGGLKVSVRPSGTEPKIKFYFEIPVKSGKPFTGADYERCTAEAEARVPAIKASLGL